MLTRPISRCARAATIALVVALSCGGPAAAPAAQTEAIASATAATPTATPAVAASANAPATTTSVSPTIATPATPTRSATPPSSTSPSAPAPTAAASSSAPATPPASAGSGTPATPVPPTPAISLPAPDPAGSLHLFRPPFDGQFRTANLFDHDIPLEFVDTNGRFVTFWGESIHVNIDGHDGYDWIMPEGTPLLAVAAGTVSFAGTDAPFACPILGGRTVQANVVNIDHRVLIDGLPTTIRSSYLHLSRVDVKTGDVVTEGQQVGLSGNTGCSTAPHLHFQVFRSVGTRVVRFDPFGWSGSGPDPWASTNGGTSSIWVWKTMPPLYSEATLPPNPGPNDNGRVAITVVHWLEYPDPLAANSQYVELQVDTRFAPTGAVDMTGWTLSTNKGDTYRFPSGAVIRAGTPVRVYAGPGKDTATALYWGRSTIVWDHLGDCARLTNPNGGRYLLYYSTTNTCG